MIKVSLLLTFLLLLLAQTGNSAILGFDVGSIKNKYFVPNSADIFFSFYPYITMPQFGTKSAEPRPEIQLTARLRSINTVYFIGRSYDLTLYGEYLFGGVRRPGTGLFFFAGAGVDFRLRFVNDARSEAQSSAEPLLIGGASLPLKRYTFLLPFWTKLYSDGISITALPEVDIRLKKMVLFIRGEFPLYIRYAPLHQELGWDFYIGAKFNIGNK